MMIITIILIIIITNKAIVKMIDISRATKTEKDAAVKESQAPVGSRMRHRHSNRRTQKRESPMD